MFARENTKNSLPRILIILREMNNRLNAYRIMWLLVFFDLPVMNPKQRKDASGFRKMMLKDGFDMFQFSIYIRPCPSRENAEVHIRRVKRSLPPAGHIGILMITDKQFGMMEVFRSQKLSIGPQTFSQLELF